MQKTNPPAEQPPTIFICYRRAETEDLAGRVSEALKAHFSTRARVFRDYDDIRAGDDFVEVIESAIGASKVLLALIGRQWLTIADAKTGKRRLDNERDHVRFEIASALKGNVRVIPVLVQDALMPGEEELPGDLKPLATRNALKLSSNNRWSYDLQQLIAALESTLPQAAVPAPPIYLAPAAQFQRYLKEPWFRKGLFVALAVTAAALVAWKALPSLLSDGDAQIANINTPAIMNTNAAPYTPALESGPSGLTAQGISPPLVNLPGTERVSQEFKDKVMQIAYGLGTDPNYLMAIMSFESAGTFSPSMRNDTDGSVGLISFTPSMARGLGTTTEALARMSAEEQLDFVAKYLRPFRNRMKTVEDAYMAVLFPAAIGKGADHVLFREGTKVYPRNRGLDHDHDGIITVGEAAARVRSRLPESYWTVNQSLPEEGKGYQTYNPEPGGANLYALPITLHTVTQIAAAWDAKHPDIKIQVGDLSRRGGGNFPPHTDHKDGREVDFRPVTNNGRLEPTNINSPTYSQELTRELVRLIKEKYPAAEITFNDPQLVSEGLTKESAGRDNHLHVRFP